MHRSLKTASSSPHPSLIVDPSLLVEGRPLTITTLNNVMA